MGTQINDETFYELESAFSEIVGELLGYSEHYSFRVTDNVKVYYIEEDIYADEIFTFKRG